MKKKEPTMNYEIMLKCAVLKLQTDAKTYNQLMRRLAELNLLWFDSEGNAITLKGQVEQARQVRRELNRYMDILTTDLEEIAEYRKLAIADGVRNRIENVLQQKEAEKNADDSD